MKYLDKDQLKLYTLDLELLVASQMTAAVFDTMNAKIEQMVFTYGQWKSGQVWWRPAIYNDLIK